MSLAPDSPQLVNEKAFESIPAPLEEEDGRGAAVLRDTIAGISEIDAISAATLNISRIIQAVVL